MLKKLSKYLILVATLSACDRAPVEPVPVASGRPLFAIVSAISQISIGATSGCGILTDDNVTCWGAGYAATVPDGIGPIAQVSVGVGHACAIRSSEANVVCWGNPYVNEGMPASLGAVLQIDAGDYNTCVVKAADSSAVCWGFDQAGHTMVPAGLGAVREVSTGYSHTCAVRKDNTVACWGSIWSGAHTPPTGLNGVVQVSAGVLDTCARKSDQTVVCWGSSGSVHKTDIKQVDVGSTHACGLKTDDTVVCWGSSGEGAANPPAGKFNQISLGHSTSCAVTAAGSISCWGAHDFLASGTFKDVAAGSQHTCGIKTDSSLQCWGNLDASLQVPVGLGAVKQVSTGTAHTCVVKADDSVTCWGINWSGQVDVPADLGSVTQVSAGHNHTCAVKADGTLACWGRDPNEQWNGYPDLQATPPHDLGLVLQVSVGAFHTCATTVSDTVRCWGPSDHFGYIGGPASATGVEEVAAGAARTCALKNNGTVSCWGFSEYPTTASMPPVLDNVIQLAAGDNHTCALKANGTVTCWGDNAAGQASPPSWLGPVSRISAGSAHSCAVVNDGTVECWGNTVVTTHILPGATTPGNNIAVAPLDRATGTPAPVTLVFSHVTGGGTTTVTSASIGAGGGQTAPAGFRVGSPPTYYDVATTATFIGQVTLCFDYSGANYGNENNLKLLHHENGVWTNVTTSLDTTSNTICGTVTSLSPFLVAEQNVGPIVTSLELPAAPVPVVTNVTATAAFTDGNPNDTHTATIDWNDGSTSSGAVTESGGSGSANGSHTYTAPGVFAVVANVSDGDLAGTRSSSSDQPAYIVVYDPAGAFVTGGGWFDSPTNACAWSGCASGGSSVGKASFGFVSRYQRGATIPTGNTEFQFKAGGLTFRSTNYEWLVVAGARAQYKGQGQIAGDGETYGFLVTAIDGALPGGGGADRFRIKLWNRATGAIVYDNQLGQLEDSNAATTLGGGSIVIHR
jgi:alpha-tubulin suppressor-like RCC1 family protein